LRAGRVGLAIAGMVLLGSVAGARDLVSIAGQDGSGLTVAFTTDETVGEVRDWAGRWAGLRIPGFVSMMAESLGLDLPARSYLVAVPPGSQVMCEVIDPSYYEISSYETEAILSELGEASNQLPEAPAQITVAGYLKDLRVAGLRIAPVVYDRASGKFRVYTSFKARIAFSGGQPANLGHVPEGSKPLSGSEVFYDRAILNYDQARLWSRAKARAVGTPQTDYFTDSSDWLKIRIDTTGIYCITGRDLESAGVAPGTIDSDGLRLYTGGGLPLVESLAEHNPDWMRMAPIKVIDGGDGKIGRADSIIFYGLGMHDWADLYDPGFGPEANYGSFYSDHNYYWLTWGGTFTEPAKRMEVVEAVGCGDCPDCYEPVSFYERLHLEEDWRYNFSIRGDDGWYWRILNLNNTVSLVTPTPHPDAARSAMVKLRLGDDHLSEQCTYDGTVPYYTRAVLRLNGTSIKDTVWQSTTSALRVVDIYGRGALTSSETQTVQLYLPTDLRPPYENGIVCPNKPSLAWYEIYYWRRFVADGKQLYFVSPDSTCTARYAISGFGTNRLLAFDLTDQFDVKQIVGFESSPGPEFAVTLCDTVRKGDTRRYAVVSRAALLKPADISRAHIENMRYAAGRPYCLITHEDLTGAGEALAQFHDGEMVTIQEIYDEFGWGVPDATAIRDFLRWRYTRGDLEYVLLLGDATWDVKGYLTGETYTNYVPSYERRYRVGAGNPYNTDDWFGYLVPASEGAYGPDSTAYFPTVPVSRLPATSPEVAEFLVDQNMEYISDPELGPWQDRVVMVADDDRVADACDPIAQGRHVTDMEAISDNAYPAVFDRVKIYLTEYPRESSGLKPAAKNDLIRTLSEGVLMSNFVGHGDPRRWAQEEVFNNAAAELVAAGRRLSLLIASSCNVSKFDEPTFASCAERLLLNPQGGTIASFASTHYCAADPNRKLHESFVDVLFDSKQLYPTVPIGEAEVAAKALTAAVNPYWQYNSEMYTLLGDPALELAVPKLEVRFDAPAPDTLERKGIYEFSAHVYEDGHAEDAFNGKARVYARESDDTTGYTSDICFLQPGNVPKHFDYDLPGAEIFRGKSTVEDGGLDFGFLVASGAREGASGSVRCFVNDGLVSGVGLLDSLVISGSRVVDDFDGPQVSLETGGSEVENGDTVLVGQALEVVLYDQSGVAVKGKSESIPALSVAVDEIERIDLGDSVYSVDGDFRSGRVAFEVPQMAAGDHRFSVTAFDNLSNSTTREYDLEVGQRGTGAADVVYVYPNPAPGKCYIIWEYESDEYIEVKATIYTLAGRKVWTGSTAGKGSQQMIEWNGTDLAGDLVANGTYLAVVEAKASDTGFETKDTVIIALVR
jgi:hypothetical protein